MDMLSSSGSIDASSLFPGGKLPEVGEVINLSKLREELKPEMVEADEQFIPQKIFIRAEMHHVFRELTAGNVLTTILSGSPGVGKSILLFLVAIYRVWKEDGVKVTYFRYTEQQHELASAFAMELDEEDKTKVKVCYSRSILKDEEAAKKLTAVRNCLGWNVLAKTNLTMVDGPLATEAVHFAPLDYLSTSGGGIKVTSEMMYPPVGNKKYKAGTLNMVLGAWTKEQLKECVIACLNLREETDQDSAKEGPTAAKDSMDVDGKAHGSTEQDKDVFNEDRFDEVYFYSGGRIRDVMNCYNDKNNLRNLKANVDSVVQRVSQNQANVALAMSDERSTSRHVDSIRSIFRRKEKSTEEEGETGEAENCLDYASDLVDIFVDSQYIMRQLRQKIRGEGYLSTYKLAKDGGHKNTEAESFEELMHWILSEEGAFDFVTGSVRALGTGSQGVSELNKRNLYWIPSIPNVVNIDAAIVGADGRVWCFQYMTGKELHGYKKRKLRPQFLDRIPMQDELGEDVTIIFVYPEGTQFKEVDVGGEVSVEQLAIPCDNLDIIQETVKNFLTGRVTT